MLFETMKIAEKNRIQLIKEKDKEKEANEAHNRFKTE